MMLTLWVFSAVVIIGVIVTILGGRKKRWYKIYLANNDVLQAYRTTLDWWWLDTSGIMGFRLADGRRIKISKHWIIKIEEEPKVK